MGENTESHPGIIKKFIQNRYTSLFFRILISALLIVYLLKLSVFERIADIFNHFSPIFLLFFYLLYYSNICLQVFRWKYLLEGWGIQKRYRDLLRLTLVGLFLNNFLPGGFGGDAFRLTSGGKNEKMEDLAATIFYERLLNYGILVLLGLITLVVRASFEEDRLFWMLLGSIFAGFTILILLLFSTRVENFAILIFSRIALLRRIRIGDWLKSFRFKILPFPKLALVFFFSIVLQLLEVFSFYVISNAIHVPVRIGDLFLFVPLLYLAVIVPISINGIGVRESVFIFFSQKWGISQAEAVAFSLTMFALTMAGSLVGGPVYWLTRREKKCPGETI